MLTTSFVGAWTWPLGFPLNFAEIGWLGATAGLVAACVRRSRARAVLHASWACAWLVMFLPQLRRGFAAEPERVEGELRLVTLNAGAGRATGEQLRDALRTFDADVVFLQELSARQAAAIEACDDLPFAHRALFPRGIPGKGLLARFPLRDVHFVELADGATVLDAVLLAPRGEVRLVDVHSRMQIAVLGTWAEGCEHIDDLARSLPTEVPTLVAGDFNVGTRTPVVASLRDAGFHEAFEHVGAGLGLSFPVFLRYRALPLPPIVRIDHVWARGLEPLDARLLPDVGSDHLPMLVRFR
ncbi:MAG: endonuclease/exonuclease/phosphatase family protein [Planctomycetota bacterium]|nr:endonuclease/exonuclease/phosphatase family protein [Planctomycetota bacterium]